MKNFLNYLQSEIAKSTESDIVRHISKEIVLKNRNKDFQQLGTLTLEYLFDIAKTKFQDEVENTSYAIESMNQPTADLQVPVWLSFTKKTSIKQQALMALVEFEKHFLINIKSYKNIYIELSDH